MHRVLIIDDEKPIRESVRSILEYEDFKVFEAPGGKEGLALLNKTDDEVHAVLLDIKMPGWDGMETLSKLLEVQPELPVVMFSGHGTITTAVDAIKAGAYHFIEKPPDADKIVVTLRNAISHKRLMAENKALRAHLSKDVAILGESQSMVQVLETVEKVAVVEVGVLITGENGTGKELVARAIHATSTRSLSPFVDVNCAAIPHELIESELFGHEAGSFTGATERRSGKFEQAHGGTLFLDEVGDMSEAAQAKILRVLETREVQRVGGNKKIPVDVRVLAATNKDLKKAVEDGEFRRDLYYRLNVVPIHIPTLRERPGDIPGLARHFLTNFCERSGLETIPVDEGALSRLASHEWPGNVRELRNFMERLAVLRSGPAISEDDVCQAFEAGQSDGADPFLSAKTFEEFKEQAEKRFLVKKLTEFGWNIKRTADELKMQRSNLYKKIDKYGLK